jgi:hypothetical protein
MLNLKEVEEFVNENIVTFHENRYKLLQAYRLKDVVNKNPYLQKAKNIQNAAELIESTISAKLSSSEEKLFGDFFEELAIFVSQMTGNGHKSAARGVDLEFIKNNIHYVIAVKSSTNWGNSSQRAKMQQDLSNCVTRLKQSQRGINVQPVEGICCGKTRTTISNGVMKVVGQNFWFLISGDKDLYKEIIEPIGFEAKKHNETYLREKEKKINLLTKEFLDQYICEDGRINWEKLVQESCGNFDLDQFIEAD